MKNIIFVCHGNICRSVMAEYLFKYYNKDSSYTCFSRATSYEEIGNGIYYKAAYTLDKNKIPYAKHLARRITKQEYEDAYLVIVMDNNNLRNLKYIVSDSSKTHLLKEYSTYGEIEDPWYTDRFDLVFSEIKEGVLGLIKYLGKE